MNVKPAVGFTLPWAGVTPAPSTNRKMARTPFCSRVLGASADPPSDCSPCLEGRGSGLGCLETGRNARGIFCVIPSEAEGPRIFLDASRRTQITDQPRCVRLELHSVFVSFRAKRRIPLPPLSTRFLHVVVRAIYFDEAARRIQHARSPINAFGTDQSGVEAARLHPAQSLDSHGAGVSSSGEIGTTTDRLEMSDAVCSVAPSDAVAEQFAGGIFQHNIEFWIVDSARIGVGGKSRRSPSTFPTPTMRLDARRRVRRGRRRSHVSGASRHPGQVERSEPRRGFGNKEHGIGRSANSRCGSEVRRALNSYPGPWLRLYSRRASRMPSGSFPYRAAQDSAGALRPIAGFRQQANHPAMLRAECQNLTVSGGSNKA